MQPGERLGRLGLVAMLLPTRPTATVVLLAALVTGCAAPTMPSESPAETLVAEDVDGRFTLTLELPKGVWRTSESIEGTMTLRYDGQGVLPLRGSIGGILLTSFARTDGSLVIGPAADAACGSHDISAAQPIVSGLVKSGGYSVDDPNAAFLNHFFAAPGIQLPPGTWTVTASTSFFERECGDRPHDLGAAVTIEVLP